MTRRFWSERLITGRAFICILSVCVFLCSARPATGQEIVSTANVPVGPTSGVSGTLYGFTASGSTDSLGNPVQYSFAWGDGYSSGWTPSGLTMSFHTWSSPGTYTVTVQARSAVDTSVVSSVSPGLVVTITGENISTPSTPAGSPTAVTGTASTYSTGSATSSLGNQVQYRLFWGDGSNSPWLLVGTTSASHSWLWTGAFTVTAQARSATNTQVLSPVSSGLSVTVAAGETISPPTAPAGPTTGTVGTSYTYSTGGSVASSGNAVSYLFEWGDGQSSGWLPAGTTSASHTWAAAGSYTVTVLAADATAPLIQSSPSSSLTVGIAPPPSIASVNPASAAVGVLVTVTGNNFGSSQGNSTVTFNGINAGLGSSWNAASIAVNVPSGATTGNVVVTVGGVASNPAAFTVTPVPSIASVSPTSGQAGAQANINGSGFGLQQGAGSVWLGTARGTVIAWSDTQIVATVATNATSGSAQVQQGGAWSNTVPFTVNTATISSVLPAAGLPGTQVTITGSGFGAAQGAGQVWLGTANGVVQSWSDTQVVAQVAAGAASGNAQILQGGVMSNAVPFTVSTPQIASISPASGPAGTQVTFTGSGFGATQGTGTVTLGSAAGLVVSWSDTSVVATVAPTALSGIARIQQNGALSNALGFIVPPPGGNAMTLAPSMLNMSVGDTHTIQALNSASLPVTGLAWASSDPTVVTLSPDDPPILTALAAGHVTITAGTASADVTVFAGPLPIGTVIWSNPGDGSGVQSIVPAVPSTTGVADVFAFQADGTVAAITSDGTVAWTAQTNDAYGIPDFQGGLVVGGANGIYKLDGITGQPYPAFNGGAQGRWGIPCGGNVLVHPDGTIFAAKGVGVDPTTGTQKFSVAAPAANIESSYDAIIAGDGYAYFPYVYVTDPDADWPYTPYTRRLAMLRVDSSGANDNFDVYEWESWTNDAWCYRVNMITNADQGILFTWANPEASASGDGAYMPHMAVTTGASASVVSPPQLPGGGQVYPVLQAQDGSYVGTACQGCAPGYGGIVSFDGTGNTRWIVPTDYPQIATDDGGVIGQSGITYDQNGNATGIAAGLPTYSWTGNAYQQDGPVEQISADLLFVLYDVASSFWAIVGGNYSGNETAYALIRTFSDNVVDANIVVTNPSQTDPNQQAITNVLSDISRALNTGSNGGCSAWLTGTATSSVLWTINSMITYQLYGHGTFEAGTAAFLGWKNQDGTLTGTPAGWAITVNDQGAFFNANLGDKTFTVGRRAYKGGTLKAQAAILIHELGHSMNAIGGAAGFQVDAGNKPAGRANDSLVDKYCGKLIESLK